MSVKNFVQCGLVTPVAANTVELVLVAPTASYQYPPLDGGTLVIADSVARPTFYEIISYTHRIDNVLYGVVRAKEGTTARSWTGVAWIYQALTAQDYVEALALKAALESPALTGIPTAPTAALGTNTNQIATMAALKQAIDALVGGAPGALDALNEFATALGNDPNFATTMTNALAGKEPSIAAGTSAQMWLGNKTWASVLTQVQNTLLTGLGAGSNATIVSTDTLIAALAKIQNQLNNKVASTDTRLTNAREWTATEVTQAEAEAGSVTVARKWSPLRVWQAVLGSKLTGINLTLGTEVSATDTVLIALGKLQKQITDAATNMAGNVRATVLTGYVTGSNAVLASTDTVLAAFGKLQAQITGLATSKLDANANAVSASKLATARTIALAGDVTGSASFDGSGNVSINAQVADDSHTHSLGNLGLGTAATKNVGTNIGDVVGVEAFGLKYAQKVTNFGERIDSGFYLSVGTSDNRPTGMVADGGWMINLNWAFNGAGNRYNCAFYGNVQDNFIGFRRINQLGEPQASVELYHTGNIGTANAGTATKLATARTINGVAFDGTANITVADSTKLPLTGGGLTGDLSITKSNPWLTLDSDSTGGSGVEQGAGISIGESGKKGEASLHLTYTGDGYGHIGMGVVNPTSGIPAYRAMSFYYQNANVTFHGTISGNGSGLTNLDANQLASGTIPDARLSGTYTGVNITGNAATATKLATARTIGMTGDVTWTSPTFDGSGNVTAAATLVNTGVTAGTYAKVTVNAKGLVTAGAALLATDIPVLHANNIPALDAGKITSGTFAAARIPTLNQNTTGNAATATKLATARTINGVAFDGTANITVADPTKVPLTSATGAAVIPAGTEAQRPASPVNGQLRYNSEKSQFEGYQGGDWKPIGGGDSSPMFSVMWWPQRSAIPAGYVAADGQTLSRATYPDAWAGIQAGNVPTVADATWNNTPTERGKFTTGDGSTTFRLPDYNGKFSGSLGAVFMRGDGALSAAIAGVIQQDTYKDHSHAVLGGAGAAQITSTTYGLYGGTDGSSGVDPNTTDAAYFLRGNRSAKTLISNASVVTSQSADVSTENRPLNVTGCWVIKLYGAVVNTGSADAAQLASDYANLASRTTALEGGKLDATNKGVCTAWVNFNGTGTVAILDSHNVSSITDNGTGDYTVNFTTPMNNANYSFIGQSLDSNDSAYTTRGVTSKNTSSLRIVFGGSAARADYQQVSIQVFGGK